MATTNSRFQRRYPAEMRERAVRLVQEAIAESGERVEPVTRVARQLAIGLASGSSLRRIHSRFHTWCGTTLKHILRLLRQCPCFGK